jgi:uncharacterized protein YqeY
MTIYAQVKQDLNTARKEGNKELVNDLQIIMGEFARLFGSKEGKVVIKDTLTDEQAIRVLTGIIKSEEKTLDYTGKDVSSLLSVAKNYMPEMISEEEIKAFIDTIDFSNFKNKMQAGGVVKKHFGTSVDGKLVSSIIQQM